MRLLLAAASPSKSGFKVFRADYKDEVGSTVDAAARFAFNTNRSAAVLLSQKMIGAKQFKNG